MSVQFHRVLQYRPDPSELKAKFRRWHVEALLNQAADLIEKCIDQLRDYSALNFAWNQFILDLETQENEHALEKTRSYPERDVVNLLRKNDFLKSSQQWLDGVIYHAQKLYDYHEGEAQGFAGWARNGQNLMEAHLDIEARRLDEYLT